MASRKKIRTIIIYKDYFTIFFEIQNEKVKDKIIWTLELIEEIEKALKNKMNTLMKKPNLKTLEQFKEEQYGKRGEPKREKLESGYEAFKMGALIQEARVKKGMTQEELAKKCGTTKSYISKIENNLKEVRISTLQKIIELGFGGQLKLVIKL